jgi:hypothetical protein
LHDRWTLLKVAVGTEAPMKRSFETSDTFGMIQWLKDFADRKDAARIVFAYEASGQGFGLYDQLSDAGIECHVVAPTHLPHTTHRRKNKTDEKDAEMILDEVRAHVLAGRKLPTVWVPNPQTRDDREAVRLRLALGEQRTQIKNQIRSLAKRTRLKLPEWFSKSGNWSRRSVQWLRDVANRRARGFAAGNTCSFGQSAGLIRCVYRPVEDIGQDDRSTCQDQSLRQGVSQTEAAFGRGNVDSDGIFDRDR